MTKIILIFGYGKWAKKIIKFLKNTKKFTEIYIKTSEKFFKIYPNKKEFKLKSFKNKIKNIRYFHICAPTHKHYEIIKSNNLKYVKLIVEKPLIKKKNELNKIKTYFKYNKIIVNYIDLYNPLLGIIKKKIDKISSLNIEFGNKSLFKKKNECISEWLDHALAILLFLFKKFSKFQIIYYKNKKINKQYFDILHLQYYFRNKITDVKLNMRFPVQERLITIKEENFVTTFNLRKKNTINQSNNLNLLYNNLKNSKLN
jgi:hypothetical protein